MITATFRAILLALALYCGACGVAHAQEGAAAAAPAGEVAIEVERLGFAKVARPGDWCGLRLKLTDTTAKTRAVLVRVTLRDADGDRPAHEREITLNPGVSQQIWLYAMLPNRFGPGDNIKIEVFESVDARGADDTPLAVRAGRPLSSLVFSTRTAQGIVAPSTGLMALVGQRRLGLMEYGIRRALQEDWSPLGHELTEVAVAASPLELPDRWMGLAAFETIVWGEGDPTELRGERAAAVREWVKRGGHLVIVLPPANSQLWTTPTTNELFDMLPAVVVGRKEGVDLTPMAGLLQRPQFEGQARRPLPKSAIVHTLTPASGAGLAEAIPILNAPDGSAIVTRRLFGAGMVTLVGLDLASSAISQVDAVNADAFWHRVLGKRWEIRTSSELQELEAKEQWTFTRTPVSLDGDIGGLIAQSGKAATGVLMAFVLFVIYWIVAGPGGYAGLKRAGAVRHSWVTYVAAAGVFTAVAWTGARLLRPLGIQSLHITVLDHVYGQPQQRARMWAGVLIPSYGTARLSVGDAAGRDTTPRTPEAAANTNSIAPWEPTGTPSSASFLDTRPYVIDSRAPNSMTVPTRATVKQLRADWSGGPIWKMPRPDTEAGISMLAREEGGQVRLSGVLTHDLPAELTDIKIIIVENQTSIRAPVAAGVKLTNLQGDLQRVPVGRVYSVDKWAAGEKLDLSAVTSTTGTLLARFLQDQTRALTSGSGIGVDLQPGKLENRLLGLSLPSYLDRPDIDQRLSFGQGSRTVFRRSQMHTLDVSRWLTEPCLIIIGAIGAPGNGPPSPIPIFVDGEPVQGKGLTLVRWVYPFPPSPPSYSAPAAPTPTTPDPNAQPSPAGPNPRPVDPR